MRPIHHCIKTLDVLQKQICGCLSQQMAVKKVIQIMTNHFPTTANGHLKNSYKKVLKSFQGSFMIVEYMTCRLNKPQFLQ